MQTQDQLMRKFSELFQEPESATLESTMKEQTVFLEQLKQKQERQLESQQLLNEPHDFEAEKRYVEAHWYNGKFRSKIRRGNNKQNHKKKGRK